MNRGEKKAQRKRERQEQESLRRKATFAEAHGVPPEVAKWIVKQKRKEEAQPGVPTRGRR